MVYDFASCAWPYRLTLSSSPSLEPVTIAEARAQCRVEINDDDTLLSNKIVAARQRCESILDRQFVTATWIARSNQFPVNSERNPYGSLFLPRPPLISITSITYTDSNGSSQTFASSTYTVETSTRGQGAVHLDYSQVWPSVQPHPQSVAVTFVAGYGAPSTVPLAIKEGILAWVCHLYENRGDDNLEMPGFVRDILAAESWGSDL
jgi:uncharacterized phiE125 gp8 family phage protein